MLTFILLLLIGLFTLVVIVAFRNARKPSVGNDSPAKDARGSSGPTRPKYRTAPAYIHAPSALKKRRRGGVAFTSNPDRAEEYTTQILASLGTNYIIFTNVIFEKQGIVKTTEIDHVVLSPYGIFCIETKSHAGSIYGGAGSSHWKQYLAGKGYSFYNPLMQNANHAKALGVLLGTVRKSMIHSYVMFPNASKIKVHSNAVFLDGRSLVAAIDAHQTQIYNRQELTEMAYAIARWTSRYESMRDVHADNVQGYLEGNGSRL